MYSAIPENWFAKWRKLTMTINDIKTNHKIIRGDSRQMKELAD